MSISKEDLIQIVESNKETFQFSLVSLEDLQNADQSLKKAQVDSPVEEIKKLVTLIKAYTTKIGIAFKPENLSKSYNAAFEVTKELSEKVFFLLSVIIQLDPKIVSRIFQEEILFNVKQLFKSCEILSSSLLDILRDDANIKLKEKGKKEDSDPRLVSVGKIWTNCDTIIKLIEQGKISLLKTRIRGSLSLIDDGLDDFSSWIENPEDIDLDTSFGFSDEESDSEVPNIEEADSEDENESKIDISSIKDFAVKWLARIKMIKLLLSSTSKSLPSVTSGKDINRINDIQKNLVKLIDEIIVDVMLDRCVDDETHAKAEEINKSCMRLIKIIKEVNKLNENNVKWCDNWVSKYKNE